MGVGELYIITALEWKPLFNFKRTNSCKVKKCKLDSLVGAIAF